LGPASRHNPGSQTTDREPMPAATAAGHHPVVQLLRVGTAYPSTGERYQLTGSATGPRTTKPVYLPADTRARNEPSA